MGDSGGDVLEGVGSREAPKAIGMFLCQLCCSQVDFWCWYLVVNRIWHADVASAIVVVPFEIYNCLSVLMRCLAWSVHIYLMPKSSTTRENVVGHHLCHQRPEVNWQGKYLYGLRHLVKNLSASYPACLRPYMPFAYFHVYPYLIICQVMQAIFVGDVIRYDGNVEVHIFILVQGSAKVVIFDIEGEEFSIGG